MSDNKQLVEPIAHSADAEDKNAKKSGHHLQRQRGELGRFEKLGSKGKKTHGETSLAEVVVEVHVGDTGAGKPLCLSNSSVDGVDDGEEGHPERHELRKAPRSIVILGAGDLRLNGRQEEAK